MNYTATSLLYDIGCISVLMLIAKVIRSKVKLIQRLYIPSALIASFLGLFLGKQFLNILPFSSEIGNYAGILIAFVFWFYVYWKQKKSEF